MIAMHVASTASAGGEVVGLRGTDGGVGFEDVEVEGGHGWWFEDVGWRGGRCLCF
jgi:hypothetical protein